MAVLFYLHKCLLELLLPRVEHRSLVEAARGKRLKTPASREELRVAGGRVHPEATLRDGLRHLAAQFNMHNLMSYE